MRAWYPALVAATIGCVLWCVLLGAFIPIGVVDRLYGSIRLPLTEAAGDDTARRLMGQISQQMSGAVHWAIALTAFPLFLTNIAWGCLAYRLLRKTGDLP